MTIWKVETQGQDYLVHVEATEGAPATFFYVPLLNDGSANWLMLQEWLDEGNTVSGEVQNPPCHYKAQRQNEYPSYADQLDYIYHNGIDAWKTDIIDPIKAKFPKPSEPTEVTTDADLPA